MDSGRYAMQNIPGDILFECGRQFAEYGGHNVESVSEATRNHYFILEFLFIFPLFSWPQRSYILIAYHHLYARIYQPRIIFLQLFLVWFLALMTMMPPLFGVWGTLGLDKSTFSCTILKKDGKSIKKFLFCVGFLLPCLVIIISYTCIYFTVRRQRQKLKKHATKSMALPAAREREDSRLTAMMLTIFICFLLCFLPLSVVNIYDDKHAYPWINTIASILAWAASVINPFIYAASNRTYRIAYYKLFAAMKFWGEPLSPMPSKSFLPSKGSRDGGSNGNYNGKTATPGSA